jgi:hypothetical protein
MALTLPRNILASQEASVEDCLRACGARLWSQAALRQYQDEQEKRAVTAHFAKARVSILSYRSLRNTLVVGAIATITACTASLLAGGAILGVYLWGKFFFHIGEGPAWHTNDLLKKDQYWRDGRTRRLPEPVQGVVDGVRIFFPDARFAVSFVGHDPILHVLLGGQQYNALVWDEKEDGTIEIILPPAD